MVNSVAFCAQAVLAEAQLLAGLTGPTRPRKQAAAPFSLEELENYLRANVAEIRKQPGFEEVAASVDRLAADVESMYHDLEDLERRLTSLEDKMVAIARTRQTEEQLLAARIDLDRELRPYRGKMTPEQLTMLEKQYLERRLLESSSLPRLSLFYLR
jgi:hypothetical protein